MEAGPKLRGAASGASPLLLPLDGAEDGGAVLCVPIWLDGSEIMQGYFNPLPPFVQGSPEFLGQAFAVPQVKLVDEPYCKPALQFFDFYKGSKPAGELIATFELIELDYSGYLEVMGLGKPCLPFNSREAAGTEPVGTDQEERERGYAVEEKRFSVLSVTWFCLLSHQCLRMWSPRSPATWETPEPDGSSSRRASAPR